MKEIILAFTFVAFASSVFAPFNPAFADVKSGGKWAADYPEVVHIIRNSDQTITFQYCEGPNFTECRNLGNKTKYKIRDLKREEQILKQQRRMMIISASAFIVGSALAATLAVAAAPTPVGIGAVSLMAFSGAAGSAALVLKSYLDPGKDGNRAKFNAPRTLTDHILNGESVQVNMPINEFAQQLDMILKDIF